jgi:hypothetical protein
VIDVRDDGNVTNLISRRFVSSHSRYPSIKQSEKSQSSGTKAWIRLAGGGRIPNHP